MNKSEWAEDWFKLLKSVNKFRKYHDLTVEEFLQVVGEDKVGSYFLLNQQCVPPMKVETKGNEFAVKLKAFMNSKKSEMPETWKIDREAPELRLVTKLSEAFNRLTVETCHIFMSSKGNHRLLLTVMVNGEFKHLVKMERLHEIIREVHTDHYKRLGVDLPFNEEMYELQYKETCYL